MPVPVTAIVRLESEGLEVMLTFPLLAPPTVGANGTVKDVLCPGLSVTGTVRPFRLNPAPLTEAAEMVTAVPPVLVSVSDLLLLLPTGTLPKERLVGFAVSVPGVTPVPESGMVRLGFAPFEAMLMLPLTAPLAAGANSTVKDVLCPAFSVSGRVSPLRRKPLPVAVAVEIVTAVPPELVNVSESDFELPTCTAPKLKLEGFGES